MEEMKDAVQPEAELDTTENEQAAQAETEPVQQEEAPGEPVVLSAGEFETVRKHIEELQAEKDEMVTLAQRIQADFDNYRKRNATLHLSSVNEGERNVIKGLLPVLDNFARAMDNCEGVNPAFVDGMRLVQRQLVDTLSKYGLAEIPADGQFDPALHEAVMQQESDTAQSGDILQVFQKGYKVGDHIIRHSMVSVAK